MITWSKFLTIDCIKQVLANLEFKLSKTLEKFKPARGGGGGGSLSESIRCIFMKLLNMAARICFHVTVYVVLLNLICNMTIFLKKLSFGPSSTPYVYPGDQTKSFKLKYHLICFISIVPLRKRSGRELDSRPRAAGSSLTGGTMLCP